MEKKYVPEGVFLACDKGTCPSKLRVSNHVSTTIYGVAMATEADKLPFLNIKPMGFCSLKGSVCLPIVLQWDDPKEGVKINGNRMLLEDSTCKCVLSGKISIHFTAESANAVALWGGVKMPTEYIKDGFDWLADQNAQARAQRDEMLPDWMKAITGPSDWLGDFSVGLVEGAVNGVVGLGETLYQVGQDPVGTAEGLWDMGSDAVEWAGKGENWSNAATGAWDWASDGENWMNAASDAGNWVVENPRGLGNGVGEFIPDAVAAVYSGGSSVAVSAGRVALREGAEEVVERVARECLEEGAGRAARETLEEGAEAGAKKAGKELVESLADDAADIPKVVTRSADDVVENQVDDVIPTYETPFRPLTDAQRKALKEKAANRTITKEEWDRLQWDRRFNNRRARGVSRYWADERKRLRQGQPGTRNWTPEQRQDILSGKTPKFDGDPIEGHHKYNALDHPQLADDAGNIYPATDQEHLHRWHGGNYQNDTYGVPNNPNWPEEF